MKKTPWKPKTFYYALAGEIRKELKKSYRPLTARQLAIKLAQSRTDINRCLYFFMRDVKQNKSFEWRIQK